jgi:creatinine amidohydrolase
MNLSSETWIDMDTVETNLALLPVGSTEQHGPHLPLETDTLNAETVAERAAEKHVEPAVVAPAIPVAIAEEHRKFAGTLWVSESTLRSYVRETVASLAFHGWDRVVVVNGHGGNTAALREVAGRITRHDDAYAVPFTWFDEVGDYRSEMGHGGPLETSLVQCAKPERIRNDRVANAAENASERWGNWEGRVNLAFDSDEFTDNGVVGNPRDGSAEQGARLLELATDSLTELLEAISHR